MKKNYKKMYDDIRNNYYELMDDYYMLQDNVDRAITYIENTKIPFEGIDSVDVRVVLHILRGDKE